MVNDQLVDVRSTLTNLWRFKALILVVAVTLPTVVYWNSSRGPKIYQSAAQVLIRPALPQFQPTGGLRGSPPVGEDLSAETQARIASGSAVADRVRKALKLERTPEDVARLVRVRALADRLLEFTARTREAELSASIVNSFAEQYLAHRREQAVAMVKAASDQLQQSVMTSQQRLNELDERIIQLSSEAALLRPSTAPGQTVLSPEQGAERATKEAEIQRLVAERNEVLVRIGGVQTRVEELQLMQTADAAAAGEVIRGGAVPSDPIKPRPVRDAVVAGLVGLAVGVALALQLAGLDRRVRTKDDAALAAGLPVLIAVPDASRHRRGRERPDEQEGTGPAPQAYRALREQLLAQGLARNVQTVLVTSATNGEGKSTTVVNLGIACASAGLRTVVIDVNLRRPSLHTLFDVPGTPGIRGALAGKVPVAAAMHGSRVPNLVVLPSGPAPRAAGDLLGTQNLAKVIAEAVAFADVVLLDGPAVSDGADVFSLLRVSDGCVLVVEARRSDRDSVRVAAGTLAHAGAHLLGLVLHRADKKDRTAGFPAFVRTRRVPPPTEEPMSIRLMSNPQALPVGSPADESEIDGGPVRARPKWWPPSTRRDG